MRGAKYVSPASVHTGHDGCISLALGTPGMMTTPHKVNAVRSSAVIRFFMIRPLSGICAGATLARALLFMSLYAKNMSINVLFCAHEDIYVRDLTHFAMWFCAIVL